MEAEVEKLWLLFLIFLLRSLPCILSLLEVVSSLGFYIFGRFN